jgi:hypothetical protein
MIALELDDEQRLAVNAPLDACIAITGACGTGKSTVLARRIARARREGGEAQPLVLSAPHGLEELAFDLLEETGMPVQRMDDVDAFELFVSACGPLFELQWNEFSADQLDPEIPGLRSPRRFADAAFRLIRRLREAGIEPREFLMQSLSGATQFYAKPPNFADPSLLAATKENYRDSLEVEASELQRQHRREIDLAKILSKLYEGYLALVASTCRMTGRDAVVVMTERLRADGALTAALRTKHRFAFVDDAAELTVAELELLRALFGDELLGVTLSGDAASAISYVRIALGDGAFRPATHRFELKRQYRSSDATKRSFHRARTPSEEATSIAQYVRARLDEGTPAHRIAVLFRSVRDVETYERTLLEYDVPVVTGGDLNVFADRRALDAMALLWNVYDPFRHDWLLRTLSNPALGLADASLAILCSEPPSPQTPLLTVVDEPPGTIRPSRWDPKRDLRLGWNVLRGEQDNALSETARARLSRFRELRTHWVKLMNASPFEASVRIVWSDGLAREGAPGSARARAQQLVLRRLLDRLDSFVAEHPEATTHDVLAHAEHRAESDFEACEAIDDGDECVRLLSIEAARGCEFDYVAVAGATAGSFPCWYAPDAFLFSPRLGMIPKENMGDGRASRTAKFTYYMFANRARERFNARERRAFDYALARARLGILVTASGRATKGTTAPEFLEELRVSGLPVPF